MTGTGGIASQSLAMTGTVALLKDTAALLLSALPNNALKK